MLRVLVANNNTIENSQCLKTLSKIGDVKLIETKNGIETLNVYNNSSPHILILDTGFEDISYIEIIDRLSSTLTEWKKCNILLTLEKESDILPLINVSKIYKFFRKPLDYIDILETVKKMKPGFEIKNIRESALNSTLLDLNFHLGSNGTKYMRKAIIECYYDYPMFHSLDNIYETLAKANNVTSEEVKDAMRGSLNPLNKYRSYLPDNEILMKFLDSKNISTRYFLEVFVSVLYNDKNKGNFT